MLHGRFHAGVKIVTAHGQRLAHHGVFVLASEVAAPSAWQRARGNGRAGTLGAAGRGSFRAAAPPRRDEELLNRQGQPSRVFS